MKKEIPVNRANRLINHGPVVLITSAYKDQANVMTVAWHMPVSSRPPLVAIAVAESRFTDELIRRSEEFVINIPPRSLLKAVDLCGSVSGRDADKFKLAGLSRASAAKVRAPLIDECISHLECGVVNVFRVGDHDIFVGEVLAASAEEELFDDTWKGLPEQGGDPEVLKEASAALPFHHLGGSWYMGAGERFSSSHS